MTRSTALALKLSLTTGRRIGEVTGMAISELSLNATCPTRTIPGSRKKNTEANRMPLSRLALRLISQARSLAGASVHLNG